MATCPACLGIGEVVMAAGDMLLVTRDCAECDATGVVSDGWVRDLRASTAAWSDQLLARLRDARAR